MEVRDSYNKYIQARKSSNRKWFSYWLDYLQKKHQYNERSINRI